MASGPSRRPRSSRSDESARVASDCGRGRLRSSRFDPEPDHGLGAALRMRWRRVGVIGGQVEDPGREVMKLRTILAASAIAALTAPVAAVAQTPPVDGGTNVGGVAPSFLALILTQPPKGFAAFSKAKAYEMSFDVRATATDAPTLLSVADGDVTSGSKLGHLSVGRKRLGAPLEASVGKV